MRLNSVKFSQGSLLPAQVTDLIYIFNTLFANDEFTVLVRGDKEPFYAPSDTPEKPHQIIFAHGFFASALHEIAHWCIAGKARRLLPDYGYWYQPDGRSAEQQREFARVEIQPQALEWVLSVAAGTEFHFSADNLGDGQGMITSPEWSQFQNNVIEAARHYVTSGLPLRAKRLVHALAEFYQTGDRWRHPGNYKL